MQSDGTYKGFLSVNFNGTPGGSQGASCGSDNDWSWPVIDQISVLGVGAVNGDTIIVQVRQTPCQRLFTTTAATLLDTLAAALP